MPTPTEVRLLLRYPVDFEIGEDSNPSRFVFAAPDGPRYVSAADAVGPLSQGIRITNADASVRSWATPAILALRLMASGNLASPDHNVRSQLLDAGRAVGADAVAGQAKVRAFLHALEQEAPAVASIEQGRQKSSATSRRVPTKPRPFAITLRVDLDDIHAADSADSLATITLYAEPLDATSHAVAVSEIWETEDHFFGPGARLGIRTVLAQAAREWPTLRRALDSLSRGTMRVSRTELVELGTASTVSGLASHGVTVQWPAKLIRQVSPRATVNTDAPFSAERPRAFSADHLFTFDWQIALGDDVLTPAEIDELAQSQDGLLKIRDQWVFVDPSRLRRILKRRGRAMSAGEVLRAAIGGEIEIDGVRAEVSVTGWLNDVRERLARQPHDLPPVPQPDGLEGTLRDYQLDGLRWMAQLVDLGLGACLADDMGLGKTIMLIALHLHRHDAGEKRPTLVVCPASVLGNWVREINRFAPDIPVHRYHGLDRSLDDVIEGFVITTYATMRRDANGLADFSRGWGMVVADEAQNVKNVRAGAAQALRLIPTPTKLALTGTPVENNLSELWAILDWTTPGLLGTYEEFRRTWSRPIERDHDAVRTENLSRVIRPFVLRRRKSDPGIAPELPPKIETDYRVNLTREQVGLYEAVVRATMRDIEVADGIKRRGLIVKLLTQLKQICNHPAHFLKETDTPLANRSGKLELLDTLLDELLAEGSSVLLFTQYAQMGHLLLRHMHERSINSQFLHGGTPIAQREEMVRTFQDGEPAVFVLSLKAAGTGLNLTRADHVIHFDRWWNPAVEDQATDRAHRIGQRNAVHVHRLISEGTIEESVAELIATKRNLADAVVNSGDGALTELTDNELADLVRLRS